MDFRAGIVLLLVIPAVALADPVAGLVTSLASDRSPKVRAQAALSLATNPDHPSVVPALVSALSDSSGIVRGSAARSLGVLRATDAFVALSGTARDPDPFVAKWAGWAVRQVVAHATGVAFGVRGLVAGAGADPDQATKALQEGVLERVLADPRFEVASTIDFSEDGPGSVRGKGEVRVEFVGEVGDVAGDEKAATARFELRVVTPSGYVAWAVKATGAGVGRPPPPPGPDDDEYTVRPPGVDARLVAIADAGKAAATALMASIEAERSAAPPR